ncbi:MAG: hypothetical protein KJO21_05465 [Verrucomicrobiae bacterium]|nr:hypothetical protein [Verrucomicrobiae bacterium]NNJ43170.1 hypothetical protein [Akkermansiaceae bacterium]
MDLESLKTSIRQLPPADQDHLASMLLMERLKRNQLIMPALHQRIDDSDPKNWEPWEPCKNSLKDE